MLLGSQRQEVGELNSDLTEMPGWKCADGSLRQRLIRGAEAYIRSAGPDNQRWFATDILHRPALAGYRAFQLLHKENPSALATIEDVHWSRWAAIVLCYPTSSDDTHTQQELVATAYARAPQEILVTFRAVLQRAVARSEPSWIRGELARLALCQTDEALRALMFGLFDGLSLTPEQTGPVLAEILRRRVLDVSDFAERFLKSPPPTEDTSRKKILIAARELLLAGERGALAAIWPAVRADASFGETLFLELSQHGLVPLASGGIFSRFSDAELAELFLWLESRFPRASDPDHRGIAHAMGPRESISQFRDAILQILQGRGTPDAVRELQRIKLAFPQYNWLYTVVLNAQTEMLRKTWIPPTAAEILTLVRDSENRLISTPAQLLDILLESLERLQLEDLKGETGRAKFLWNETSKGKFQPKDEPSLSDYIKGFLQRDLRERGIIVNREVEVFRAAGAGKGPATDIHVDVIPRNQKNTLHLRAVIEVKGSWHPELKTAMRSQLIDKYLQGPDCCHGIYLVAWFDQEQWDAKDYRKKDAPQLTLAEMRKFFERQAAANSTSERIIRSFVLDGSY
jgi:hypothetical protein